MFTIAHWTVRAISTGGLCSSDLEYLPAENVMVVKKKEHFYSLTETEHLILPVFTMQVWNNDTFTPDDFIGEWYISHNNNIMFCAHLISKAYPIDMA